MTDNHYNKNVLHVIYNNHDIKHVFFLIFIIIVIFFMNIDYNVCLYVNFIIYISLIIESKLLHLLRIIT
jgi:hypothetical protein